MIRLAPSIWALAASAGLAVAQVGEERSWRGQARKLGLSATETAQLDRDSLLITNSAFRQVFTPYIENSCPAFITSDALLVAYHRLHRESLVWFEEAMARRLPGTLQELMDRLDKVQGWPSQVPELHAPARRRARLVVGVARRLLEPGFRFGQAELDGIVTAEINRIARGQVLPLAAWLGPRDGDFAELDYSRYRPRGFYRRSEGLKRYFQAVAWLHSIPFRLDVDAELVGALVLGRSLKGSVKLNGPYSHWRVYRRFLGPPDDWDLAAMARVGAWRERYPLRKGYLDQIRRDLRMRAAELGGPPRINDQAGRPGAARRRNNAFRVIGAVGVPGSVLFQRVLDLDAKPPVRPDGLLIPAALGSPWSRALVARRRVEGLIGVVDAAGPLFRGPSLYHHYLQVVACLVDAPDRDFPSFMRSEAWQIKSVNTLLGGWAQLRHAWVLHAKQAVMTVGRTLPVVGFVEPDPDFYHQLGRLVDATVRLFEQIGALPEGREMVAALFDDLARIAAKTASLEAFRKQAVGTGPCGVDRVKLVQNLQGSHLRLRKGETWGVVAPRLRSSASKIRSGDFDLGVVRDLFLQGLSLDVKEHWASLARLARRCERLAHKQLRGISPDQEERGWVKRFGEDLARIMGYGGHASRHPLDDAPKVVDLLTVLDPTRGRSHLHVGVARPRRLLVLYPWRKRRILCAGAVLPYYEFTAPTRLTDAAWKVRLDGMSRPPIPTWLAPIVAGGGLAAPKGKAFD